MNFCFGKWDKSFININCDATPMISIYIAASMGDKIYSLYRWDNLHLIFGADHDHHNQIIIDGVDEI